MGVDRSLVVTILVFVFTLVGGRLTIAADNFTMLYDDPRIVRWSSQYLKGKADSILKDVEADLLSDHPHPFSAQVWTQIHWRRDRLNEAWEAASVSLRVALGTLPKLRILTDDRRYSEMLIRWPSSEADTITDPWALIMLADAADVIGEIDARITYLLTTIRRYPNHFQPIWDLTDDDTLAANERRERITRLLSEDRALAGTYAGRYLSNYLTVRPWNPYDRLAALEQWLAGQPKDSRALTARSYALKTLYRYPEAAEAQQLAIDRFPFYSNYYHLAEMYLRDERFEEATTRLKQIFVSFYGQADHRYKAALVAAHRDAGELGRARSILQEALVQWPNEPRMLKEMSELELASDRADEAIAPAKRAVAGRPDHLDTQLTYLEALQEGGELEAAWHGFEALRERIAYRSPSFWWRGSQILAKLDRHEDRIALMEQALESHPKLWMRHEHALALWQAGHRALALKVLKEALADDPTSTWAVFRLAEYTEALHSDTDAARAALEDLAKREPWQQTIWSKLAMVGLSEDDLKEKARVWRRAIVANPGAYWPWEALVRLYTENDLWEEADTVAQEAYDSLEQGTEQSRIERHLLRALPVRYRASNQTIAGPDFERAVADLERYAELSGNLWDYHASSYWIWRTQGEIGKARTKRHALRYARFDPQQFDILIRAPVHDGAAGFHRGARLVERNPLDGKRLLDLAQYHIRWGGSNIVGLKLIKDIERQGLLPTSDYQDLASAAYLSLGDPLRRFELYRGYTSISPSDRYVGWYNYSRKQALGKRQNRITLHLNGDLPEAEIRYPNGEIGRRIDHPITGKIMLLSKGPAYVKAEYDPSGQFLERIKSSSGQEVNLTYNANEEITHLESSGGKVLDLEYNPRNKPVRITMKGVGNITVTYDEHNVIKSVKSEALDGREGDHRIALEVTSSFQQLISLIELLDQPEGVIPTLPFRDPALERLVERHEALEGSPGQPESTLDLASYLLDHLGDDAKYVERVQGLLDNLVPYSAEDVQGGNIDFARGQAIMLWHRLSLLTKPKGIPGEQYKRWGELREWLRRQALKRSDERFGQWFEAVDASPLTLLPEAYWLPDSDLSNGGLWRRFGRADLLPRIQLQASFNAVLVRTNGDLVVGSNAGLSVLRSGYWEWYTFDDNTGRLSQDADPNNLTVAASVLSLAETLDGTLWIGTANGLLAVGSDYLAKPQRWHSESEGLPSRRIESLVADEEQLWISTPAGLLRLTLGSMQPEPVELVSGAISGLQIVRQPGSVSSESLIEAVQRIRHALSSSEAKSLSRVLNVNTSLESRSQIVIDQLAGSKESFERLIKERGEGRARLQAFSGQVLCSSDTQVYQLFEQAEDILSAAEQEAASQTYSRSDDGPELAKQLADLLKRHPWTLAEQLVERERLVTELRGIATGSCSVEDPLGELFEALAKVPLTHDEFELLSELLGARYLEEGIVDTEIITRLQEGIEPSMVRAQAIVASRREFASEIRSNLPRLVETRQFEVIMQSDEAEQRLTEAERKRLEQMRNNATDMESYLTSLVEILTPDNLTAATIAQARNTVIGALREFDHNDPSTEQCPSDGMVYEMVLENAWLFGSEKRRIDAAYYSTNDGRELAGKLEPILASTSDLEYRLKTVSLKRQSLLTDLVQASDASACVSRRAFYKELAAVPVTTNEAERIDQSKNGPNRIISEILVLLIEDQVAAKELFAERGNMAQAVSKSLGIRFLLINSVDGLFALNDGEMLRITNAAVDDFAWNGAEQQLIVLQGETLKALQWPPKMGIVGEFVSLPDQNNLRFEKQIYGLKMLDLPDLGQTLAVLTDQGMSLYRDWHFEHFSLPFAHQRGGLVVGPEYLAMATSDLFLATHEGIYVHRPSRVSRFNIGPVTDLLTDDNLGITFVARKQSNLAYVDHEVPQEGPQLFASVRASHLTRAPDGSLITNNGHEIIRFNPGDNNPHFLFSAVPSVDLHGWNGAVTSITVAKDGVIWVTAGSSLFRYAKGKASEFNYALDPKRAPFKSQKLSRVLETVDGRIWIVASNEQHLNYQGVLLEGGLFEWRDDNFIRLYPKAGSGWFITGYTRIGENMAIAGSVSGFVRHTAAKEEDGIGLQTFYRLGESSYRELRANHPMLWLGRDGTKLGEQSWLFPSAGGLVLYHRGAWYYPNRINQMLPDDQTAGQWGGRTVHAVERDAAGRLYAATDRGLLIYTDGSDEASLLINNDMSLLAFSDQAVNRERQLRDLMLDRLTENSEVGRLLAELKRIDAETEKIKTQTAANSGLSNTGSAGAEALEKSSSSSPSRAQLLRKRLRGRERARNRVLARLEQAHYGFYQQMHLKPRELAAMHRELTPQQAVVQYIPTPKKLYIQVVSRDKVLLREVAVARETLFQLARNVAQRLREVAAGGLSVERGVGKLVASSGSPLIEVLDRTLEQGKPELEQQLAALYKILLRPVERDLVGAEHLFVVPVGALTYVPFAALVRTDGQTSSYAGEHFQLGVLNSFFHLNLVLRHKPSYATYTLLLGDPDGTLPGAKAEVERLAKTLDTAMTPFIGSDATWGNLSEHLPDARVAHLATHGILDRGNPLNSYLQLADGYRLNVSDIETLQLPETDLAVLSACESGVGADGLEYAHLARAFAHAQVPSVVASLWRVDDGATQRLMLEFHQRIDQGADVFSALAGAQRDLIRQGPPYDHPAAWAAFVAYGRP